MRLAVIPARGGSKRIPKKNVRDFLGKPMIAYSIEAALVSGLFDRVIVSTDDECVAQVAKAHGAEVPFVRPSYLSDDHAVIKQVMKHAVEWVEANIGSVEYACCIYATAPMLDVEDLRRGYEQVSIMSDGLCLAVTRFSFPIQRALSVDGKGYVRMIQPEHTLTRSQDLPDTYHDAAQFIWGRGRQFTCDAEAKIKAVVIPNYRVQDIDTEEDWIMAESLYGAQCQNGVLSSGRLINEA